MDSLLPPRTVEADLGSVLCAKSAHRQTGTGETAAKLLLKRQQELQAGTYIEPSAQRIVISELLNGLLADYEANELHSLDITRQRINKRSRPYFGHVRAINLTTDALNHYIAECRKGLELTGKPKQKPLENVTINRDLAALKRASPGANSPEVISTRQ